MLRRYPGRCLAATLIVVTSISGCSIFRGNETRSVTINVVAVSVPPGAKIFIVGSGSPLGNWQPGAVPMNRRPDGSWTRTFRFDPGTEIYFKITRGNWNTEALDERDPQIGAIQHLIVVNDTTISLEFSKWMDRDAGPTVLKPKLWALGYYPVSNAWRYHAGDDSAYASPSYNDSSWAIVNTRLEKGNHPPGGWNGMGWFRIHLEIDSSLRDQPVAFSIRQGGASETYLDGKKLYTFGRVGLDARDERISFPDQNPEVISFGSPGDHVLAVRYSNMSATPMQRSFMFPGFQIAFSNWSETSAAMKENLSRRAVFTTILAVLALIHLLLFIFNPRFKENLFYSISTLGGVGVWVANGKWIYSISERYIARLDAFAQVSSVVAIVFGLLLVYSFAAGKMPRRIYAYMGLGVVFIVWGLVELGSVFFYLRDVFTIVMFLEMVWGIVRIPQRERVGRTILIAGFSVLAFTVFYGMLPSYGLLQPSFPLTQEPYIYGLVALGVAMSVFLSMRFARTHRELELRLAEVSRLSEQTIAQERSAHEAELERRLLAADNQRKTRELEDARALQLSMLPSKLPSVPGLDIAVHMETATEVGGDYYDFFVTENGKLTAVIGDATGHGLKAGNMVTVTKGLFSVLSRDGSLDDIMKTSNRAIKQMNFHMLTMCLAMVRVQESRLEFSSAGMPPLLIYRKNTGKVEQLVLKAMPLGAFYDFPYEKSESKLTTGDVLLMVSDGLTELFNDRQETFGMERLAETLGESGGMTANEIVARITERGDYWRHGAPLHDDFTILVIKIIGQHPGRDDGV